MIGDAVQRFVASPAALRHVASDVVRRWLVNNDKRQPNRKALPCHTPAARYDEYIKEQDAEPL